MILVFDHRHLPIFLTFLLCINSRYFSTVINEQSLWEEPQAYKIYSSNLEVENYFGWSVSIYGNYALIGSYGGTDATQIWIKKEVSGENSVWYRDVILKPSDAVSASIFGYAVSLYEDYALVGCPMHYIAGHAYMFYRDWRSGQWSQTAKLSGNDDYYTPDFFGGSVSLHDNIAAVSAWKSGSTGAVYIFYKSFYGRWSATQKIVAADSTSYDYFGRSVSLGSGIILIGAHGDDDAGLNSGSAYIFITSDGTNWSQEAKLVASDGYIADNFGESVALYDDTAVIGAKYTEADRSSNLETGGAYVYVRQAPDNYGQVAWLEEVKLESDSVTPYSGFGASVGVARDTIIVGSQGEYSNKTGAIRTGSAFIYQRVGESQYWSHQARLEPHSGKEGDFFGKAVAIDMRAQKAIVGAYGEDKYCLSCGAVYIFEQISVTSETHERHGSKFAVVSKGALGIATILFIAIGCRYFWLFCSSRRNISTTVDHRGNLQLHSRPLNFLRTRTVSPFRRLDGHGEVSDHSLDSETGLSDSRKQVDLFEMSTFHRRGYQPPN